MFTNEDFDLDEDFLNDVSQKESQILSSDEEGSAKRIKKDEDSSRRSDSNSITNLEKLIHDKSKKHFQVGNNNDLGGDKTIHRTNLILERLKRNENTISGPSICQRIPKIDSQSLNPEKSSLAVKQISHPPNDEFRRTLILEVFKRNKVESISTRHRSPEKKSYPTNLNNVILNNSTMERCETVGRPQLKPATTYKKPVTLVRQFPGPAGLLPHLSDEIIPPLISESSCLDHSNNETNTDIVGDTSMISKYCSQNTTNSFSEGAWQSLISDLSPDFLNGHEISTVKQKAFSNSYIDNRVPFLAGIVQRVDFTCLDPLVVLKDRTGTIEGTICKDVLAEYPHSLDIGVVLFLKNVGLLTIGSYLKKCHVIIGLKNILNVYMGDSRIFSISEMDARLQNLNNSNNHCESVVNRVLSSSYSSNSKFECRPNIGRVRAVENTNSRLHLRNLKNFSNLDSSSNDLCRPIVTGKSSAITNKLNNSEASNTSKHEWGDLEKNAENLNNFKAIKNSLQPTDHTNNMSNTFESGDLQDFDDELTASFFDIDDNLIPKAEANNDLKTNSGIETHTIVPRDEEKASEKNTVLKATHRNAKLSQGAVHVMSKASDKYDKSTEKSEATDTKTITASKAKEKSNLARTSDIKLKLSVYRSDTELTPQSYEDLVVASKTEINKQNNECAESNFTSGLLLNGENDSDEELFSQLDVDSIVSQYNGLNDVN